MSTARRVSCLLVLMALACPLLRAGTLDAIANVIPTQPVDIGPVATIGLQLPVKDKVVFHGVVSMDKAGGPAGTMLYPAPDPLTLMAGVLAHAMISHTVRDSQKEALQEKADEVLAPYQGSLGSYLDGELETRSLAQAAASKELVLVAAGDNITADWVFHSEPVFAMTQDRRALVMDNRISLYARANPEKPVYLNTVRVVSAAISDADPAAFWQAENGEHLKDMSAHMLLESLVLVKTELQQAGTSAYPQKTVHYPEGGTDMIERASILSESCDHLVIRTLRGWVMSVPRKDASACAAKPASPVASS